MAEQEETLTLQPNPSEEEQEENWDSSSQTSETSESSSESWESDSDEPKLVPKTREDPENDSDSENTAEENIKRFTAVLNNKYMKKEQNEEEKEYEYHEDLFDFPKDPENWREEDVKELWADAPVDMTKPGWDPADLDQDEVEVIRDEIKAGRDPPIAPFYLPYRKPYPVIPDNHFDISSPKSVIEELDRIEEFLTWVSYVFEDGSTYEGTVWDDLAHGKGVYVAERGLVRYEGEWLQNNMEGHGVVEVDIPDIEPVPGSKLEEKMRAEGKIIKRDFMTPEDKEWLEMDIEDSLRLAQGNYEIPFYENEEWIRQYGKKPEKGRYRYAGEWKHSRMHGCGLYEVNERTIFGRFYFGELLENPTGCDEEISAMHAGIAEVAAAKARMFVNKPDGMVREQRGPYSDPQHPYFYEEDDVWMAPGFINQFYEVPDYWKTYVHEVDEEREMWLNSFYKAPLRLPMPSELEYWWSKDEKPEFVLINNEPEPDPEDPTKLVYTEDPLILHTPTGRIINYVEDDEHGIRLYWQPSLEEGEDVDPKNVEFLPLGFDEFYGRGVPVKQENIWTRLVSGVERALNPTFEKLEKWAEEQKDAGELRMKLIEKELELVEAEIRLEEAIEEEEELLKMVEKEEEKKQKKSQKEEGDILSSENPYEDGNGLVPQQDQEDEEDAEEDEEDEDEVAPSSFGSVIDGQQSRHGKSPFSSASLSLAFSSPLTSHGLISMIPSRLQNMFSSWKGSRQTRGSSLKPSHPNPSPSLVNFTQTSIRSLKIKATRQTCYQVKEISEHSFKKLSGPSSSFKSCSELINAKRPGYHWPRAYADDDLGKILSLHTCLESGIL